MKIGVVKEIKNNEYRVGLAPAGTHTLTENGHEVYIEKSAGAGSGFEDSDYTDVGGKILNTADEIYNTADIIVKVKEPMEQEYNLLKEGQTIYTFLHLAADKPLAQKLMEKKITGLAYETVTDAEGKFPLLMPMSEVSGRLSTQIGANLLLRHNGGSGVLLGGVSGVLPGEVLVIGGGVVGANAAKMAIGLGARVTIMDINVNRLRELADSFGTCIQTQAYSPLAAAELVKTCDLLISGVYVAGAKAPKVVTSDMVKGMKKGSVIIDVAIDQGGSIETANRVSSHDNPTYEEFGVIHYAVANMPGSVPFTSTKALTNTTLPLLLDIANKGVINAIKENPHLKNGINTFSGFITHKAVAESLELEFTCLDGLI